jgi:hypothetical protein
MTYIYITNEPIDIQQVVDVNGTQKLKTVVNCVSGIVGDTYGFQKIDKLTLYTDVTLTYIQSQESIAQQCIDFVNTNYPPTN